MEALEEAVSRYQAAVTFEAIEYLSDRGLDAQTVGIARLGVVEDPLPEHVRYAGFLAIPYLDKEGRPLTIRFRCLQEHNHREHGHGKYMSLPDDPPRMYGIGNIFRADEEIHVTEGEMDCLVLNQIGLPAVAIPGAALWQARHRIMLAGFNWIWVWGDPDEAGAEFSRKITRAMARARAVRLTEGDVSETFVAGGMQAILDLLPERV